MFLILDLATTIECQIYVDSFDSVSEAAMDYTVSILMELSWTQRDLYYNFDDVDFFEIDNRNMEKIWLPDLYFPNEKMAAFHKIMTPNKVVRLYPDGRLTFYARLSLTMSCPMNLRKYPFDKQICALQMESFGFDQDNVILAWAMNDTPVAVNDHIILPQFEVVSSNVGECAKSHPRLGNHSCLEALFHLERNIGYYIIQMYIPSILIVVISWISFWLTVTSVPGRISLGVLTVLTMTTQSSGVNASLPRVSYTKAIDIWMSTCLLFVFAALLEFAIVNFISRRSYPDEVKTAQRKDSAAMPVDNGALMKETMVMLEGGIRFAHEEIKQRKRVSGIECAQLMDNISRLVFPFIFISFNIVYWTYYLTTFGEELFQGVG
ncbi:hypothetical protein LOTGIDRAFT_125321 [Lottia gigantea]|uniref:Uncharacterized protein n=1 Tax=Lottia gigantea TaxID=225164 RepID=V4A3I5_LOTGI|nr:hypothetical protein LOTGIDRAFT_125321 [Lottia gigantea]ESO89505.1 hypothetical protein LOTGIDRAFT_125321 [Lottia gigantea]